MIEIDLGISSCGLIKAPESEGCPPKPTLVLGCIAPKMFGDPNIVGDFHALGSATLQGLSGAFFYITENVSRASTPTQGQEQFKVDYGFHASNSSATYSGTELQPSAIQALPCIRT